MSQAEEKVDPYADMPSLMCGICSKVVTPGGSEWQREHPDEPQCTCERAQTFRPILAALRDGLGSVTDQ